MAVAPPPIWFIRCENVMKPSTVKIISTERIKQRFSPEQIQHFVDRSLFKLNECTDQVVVWVSHYRTVFGEITVIYAKGVHAAKVAYRDEVPQEVTAFVEGPSREGSTEDRIYRSDYKLTEDEWKKQTQELWRATGGEFNARLPRPDHKEVAGMSFVTNDKDLVSADELANDPLFNDIQQWYKVLEARSERFKIAAVAYHWDGDMCFYTPVLACVGDISEYGPTCRELFQAASKKFVEEMPSMKPTILFASLWVTDDDLDDVRAQLCTCVGKAMAILTGEDTHYQSHDGTLIFHAASPSLTEDEQFELSKGFEIQGE